MQKLSTPFKRTLIGYDPPGRCHDSEEEGPEVKRADDENIILGSMKQKSHHLPVQTDQGSTPIPIEEEEKSSLLTASKKLMVLPPCWLPSPRSSSLSTITTATSATFPTLETSGGGQLNFLPTKLGIDEDRNWLNEKQCFIRDECLEVFQAMEEHVGFKTKPPVVLGQIGIRCRFCTKLPLKKRKKRWYAFPSSLNRIYGSLNSMIHVHFDVCEGIPPKKRMRVQNLSKKAKRKDTREFWIHAAKKLGMMDVPTGGISMTMESHLAAMRMPGFHSDSEQPLKQIEVVNRKDRKFTSEYIYNILTQAVFVTRKGKSNDNGLGCKHCVIDSTRFGTAVVYIDRPCKLRDGIDSLYNHFQECDLCPPAVKTALQMLHNHSPNKDVWSDACRRDIWSRLSRRSSSG